ncbi:uncharacterized protein FOMMEDRAFT_157729 [Fomitiporia mediterranea MF3/22]|uniref:uncharacterized protein n=1 Tax=Fomitiporia mediterranea (strain MF3/22) TaxID=694068 RepID=UPI0004408D4B|nr:uncharacterized protein FOMMEDRAFT_157729 [Fomitiporia mediterranea MF3/22]EJD02506.1 hypothetical protein FOMMEDRAFT_157729 [Fomitiporia mediterranea MF3/22]
MSCFSGFGSRPTATLTSLLLSWESVCQARHPGHRKDRLGSSQSYEQHGETAIDTNLLNRSTFSMRPPRPASPSSVRKTVPCVLVLLPSPSINWPTCVDPNLTRMFSAPTPRCFFGSGDGGF